MLKYVDINNIQQFHLTQDSYMVSSLAVKGKGNITRMNGDNEIDRSLIFEIPGQRPQICDSLMGECDYECW